MPKKYNYTKKTGRPLKTISDYLPEGWQQTIFELSAQGCSDVEIRAHFVWNGLTKTFNHSAWDVLLEREDEFLATINKAKCLCQAWWEKVARESITHKAGLTFETGAWYANMKNRFGWRDKHDHEHSGEIVIDLKSLVEQAGKISTNRISKVSQN